MGGFILADCFEFFCTRYSFAIFCRGKAGIKVIKLEYSIRLKLKHNDWLLADTCRQAANHCALF